MSTFQIYLNDEEKGVRLRGRKLYDATCGPERLFDWFNDPAIDLPSPVIQIELEAP